MNLVPGDQVVAREARPPGVPLGRDVLDLGAADFRVSFGRRSFRVHHHLADHPLFAISRLLRLSRTLPPANVEYNAGDLPVSVDPALTPRTGLSAEETIRRIHDCRSWMVLKNVEVDPDYRALLGQCLDQIQALSEPVEPGMCLREAFIFLSSPRSVTPYHIDNEQNFLLQISGRKTVHVFDPSDRSLVSEEQLEHFYAGAPRNLTFKDEYQPEASVLELRPGDGIHIPLTAPHWVQNLDDVSISFSITFRTRRTELTANVHTVNHYLRSRGFRPTAFGRSPIRDFVKSRAFVAWRRAKRLLTPVGSARSASSPP